MDAVTYLCEVAANDPRLPKVVTRMMYRNGRRLGQVTYREHDHCWPFLCVIEPIYLQ